MEGPLPLRQVEVVLRELAERLDSMFAPHNRSLGTDFARFSNLASETVVRIREDCARFQHSWGAHNNPAKLARNLWAKRQEGAYPDFPPLTVYLDDDGKVCLR